MAYINETPDITGYYDQSYAETPANSDPLQLADMIATLETPLQRWPIRNAAERTEIPSRKRAIIHDRDGHICRYCGTRPGMLTIDHIIPRSAFPADQLHIADRSDNLISACWECNMGKSNYENNQRKKMGVTTMCWDCQNHVHPDEERPDRPGAGIMAYCGQCGITMVPGLEWIL